jgi:predicted acylesterase/phospholipase RssA
VLRLEDAVRGSVAVPGLFPAWRCASGNRHYRLQDAGVVNCLPADALFEGPFRPVQVLAVDVSARESDRKHNLAKLRTLRRRFPAVPIAVHCCETVGGATILYRANYPRHLVLEGKLSAAKFLASCATAKLP